MSEGLKPSLPSIGQSERVLSGAGTLKEDELQ